MENAPYTPPQWSSGKTPIVVIYFPGQPSAPQYQSTGVTAVLPNSPTQYAFDAVIRAEHQQRIIKTDHPIQTGANISDHAYLMPARLILDVGMSDVMAAFYQGTWNGSSSKSVSAYQTMIALQASRIPLTLTTRLRSYQNMIIEGITPEDTAKTVTGLKMTVEFSEVLLGSTQVLANSARPQDTQSTPLGSVTPVPPTSAQQSQNNVVSLVPAHVPYGGPSLVPAHVPGAGTWSSVNTSNLSQLSPN